ncbi:MAG: tRNA (adenosine(37)-N6)-threonylcarbamoyltransferase complex dimerization subunit type 1 TsaB [Oscillospiraceae bacterium]|nr:tRNA (adenosine(37)-N6)-threonylcarbamoyltransferase complex dimerization subunit type 1 TsaB [Oscillospiraceae bacterium]
MKILAIEASAKAASACICEDGKILGEVFLNCGLTHSVTVMPSVEWLLKTASLTLADIDRIAITRGPGSFTGLRIGMAAVKGLAFGAGIPCCGVSTLECAAYGAKDCGKIICAVMDARAGQVYNALFSTGGGSLKRLCPDRAIKISELYDELDGYDDIVLTGDGALLCHEAMGKRYTVAPEHVRYQRAAYVAALCSGSETECVSAQELTPEYIRLPQAERERLERIKKEGI